MQTDFHTATQPKSAGAGAKVVIREYNAGETIVPAGAACNRFYVILKGAVEILCEGIRVRLLRAGDIFGIEYFYLQQPFTTAAIAMTAARVAAYDVLMLQELVYSRPHLMQQLLKSIARQLEQTVRAVSGKQAGVGSAQGKQQQAPARGHAPDEGIAVSITTIEPGETNFHDDILCYFIEESKDLLADLQKIGESLRLVGIPSQKESAKLREFAQKLNRLIGGTAAMGFEQFTQLSRKTSLLATRCAEIHDLSIRIVISNLNLVVATLIQCFKNLDAIKDAESMVPALEQRLDICMTAVGIAAPDIKTQSEIDYIMSAMRAQQSGTR